jgi:hypothetical protein
METKSKICDSIYKEPRPNKNVISVKNMHAATTGHHLSHVLVCYTIIGRLVYYIWHKKYYAFSAFYMLVSHFLAAVN